MRGKHDGCTVRDSKSPFYVDGDGQLNTIVRSDNNMANRNVTYITSIGFGRRHFESNWHKLSEVIHKPHSGVKIAVNNGGAN